MSMDRATEVNLFEVIRLGSVATGLLVLLATVFLVRFSTRAIKGIGARFVDKRLLLAQISTLLRFGLYLLGIAAAVLLSLNLSRDALLAVGGTAAVTIGFALKDLASSVLAGIVIIMDRPFQVGDRIKFGDIYGEVQSIGLRSVRLVTLDDNLVTIPNSKFLTDPVSSGNSGALDMLVQLDFLVAIDQDIPLAKRLVAEGVTSSRYAYTKRPWVVLVSQHAQDGYLAVHLRAKAHVLDVQYEKAFETDVTERVLQSFKENAIAPPSILHRSIGAPMPGARAA